MPHPTPQEITLYFGCAVLILSGLYCIYCMILQHHESKQYDGYIEQQREDIARFSKGNRFGNTFLNENFKD